MNKPTCAELAIRVVGEWPPPPDEDERNLSLLLYLFKREDAREPGFDPRKKSYPDLVVCAASLLIALADESFKEGFIARIDAAIKGEKDESWPRWCLQFDQFKYLLQNLAQRAAARDPELARMYPFSIWFVPPNASRAEGEVELFRKLPFDELVMDAVFSSGVVKLSISDAFCDVIAGFAHAERTLQWLIDAVATMPNANISWMVGT